MKADSSEPSWGLFGKLRRRDKIAYYATGDKVIVGIFEIDSDKMEVVNDDKFWGRVAVHHIKPDTMPPEGEYLNFKDLLFSKDSSFELFPEKAKWQYKIWNNYIHRLSDADLLTIRAGILERKHPLKAEEKEGRVFTDRLGTPVEKIGLLFEPIDEMGVVYLFASHHRRLGFPFIVRLRNRFPDVTALDTKGETKLIELEYRSSNFPQHDHDPNKCDYLVCWENDWEDAPTDTEFNIISLKEALADIFTH